VVAAVRYVREVVADTTPLRSVVGLEDAQAAGAGVGGDQPVGAHCGFFVLLPVLSGCLLRVMSKK
jgi:hypothetical protein